MLDVVLDAVLEPVDEVSALVMFLQDEVAFEGTVAVLDNVKSAHYNLHVLYQSILQKG